MLPAPSAPTDAELALRVVHGPDAAEAFDALHARHAARLLAYLRDRFPAHADDLAQEAWTRAFARLRAGDAAEMSNFRGWLFRIASNAGTDEFRAKRAAQLGTETDAPDPKWVSPLEGLLDMERRDVVRRCLEKLDPEYRAVIAASSAGEKPVDTAARLGVSRAVIDQRKSRGLTVLRTCVEYHLP